MKLLSYFENNTVYVVDVMNDDSLEIELISDTKIKVIMLNRTKSLKPIFEIISKQFCGAAKRLKSSYEAVEDFIDIASQCGSFQDLESAGNMYRDCMAIIKN